MTTDVNENLLAWLKDAHAMEQQAEHMLKAQASRLDLSEQCRDTFVRRRKRPQQFKRRFG